MTENPEPGVGSDVPLLRLKDRADFIRCRSGARSHERAFVLQLCKRPLESKSAVHGLRVGFTVTKKIGNAVIRNRIKRRLREAVRLASRPPQVLCHDAVLIARAEAQEVPFADLVSSVEKALQQADRAKASGAGRGETRKRRNGNKGRG